MEIGISPEDGTCGPNTGFLFMEGHITNEILFLLFSSSKYPCIVEDDVQVPASSSTVIFFLNA